MADVDVLTEQAAAFGRDALCSAADLDSTITTERLRVLHRQLQPLRHSSPGLRDLDGQLTSHFRRHPPDNTTL